MNNSTIRLIKPDEYNDFIATMFLAAGRPVDQAFVEERRESFNPQRSFGAYHNNKLVGTIGTRPLEMTLPGGTIIPVAAIGQGGVLPTHTRSGLMRELMSKSMRLAYELNEPAAVWTTSEWPLYGRFGGGVSSFAAEFEFNRPRVKIKDEYLSITGEIKLVSLDEASRYFPSIHTQASLQKPGGVARNAQYWKTIFDRLESGKSLDVLDTGGGYPAPLACLYNNVNGEADGCVIFRIINKWKAGLSKNEMQIIHFTSITNAAGIALWTFLLRFDLIETIILPHRPVDEPLRWLITDGRRILTKAVYDHIWFRALDPVECLKKRKFPITATPICIQIIDKMGFANTGVLEISSDGNNTYVEASNASPDITLDIEVFSSVFMGGISLFSFVQANRVEYSSVSKLSQFSSMLQSFEPPFTDTSF